MADFVFPEISRRISESVYSNPEEQDQISRMVEEGLEEVSEEIQESKDQEKTLNETAQTETNPIDSKNDKPSTWEVITIFLKIVIWLWSDVF